MIHVQGPSDMHSLRDSSEWIPYLSSSGLEYQNVDIRLKKASTPDYGESQGTRSEVAFGVTPEPRFLRGLRATGSPIPGSAATSRRWDGRR